MKPSQPSTPAQHSGPRTVGVEEELLLVDERTGAAIPVSEELMRMASGSGPIHLEREVKQEQIEVVSAPCSSLAAVAESIREGRRVADEAARAAGARAVALGTSVVDGETHLTLSPRYLAMSSQFGVTMREQLTCGFHVHVGIESDAEGIAVLDRVRAWLPLLHAMSANSPIWRGEESGYASYRYQLWGRWPSAGPYDLFGSVEAYRRRAEEMFATGVVQDAGMLYFDARLSDHVPTVEFRVADICMEAEHAVGLVALVRALVDTAAQEWRDGIAPASISTAVLRLEMWSASRFGATGSLRDPRSGEIAPANEVGESLLAHIDASLRKAGDRERAVRAVRSIFANGTGADRQLRILRAGSGHRAVVGDAIHVTHGATVR